MSFSTRDKLRTIKKLNKINDQIDYLTTKYSKRLEKEVTKICTDAITEFYKGYKPIYYRRGRGKKRDLFNIFEINIVGGSYSISFDSSRLKRKYRVDKEYIYDVVFKLGWHGGATPFPYEKPAYYRTPFPTYDFWGRRAEREDISPFNRIKGNFDNVQKKLSKDFGDELNKKISPKLDDIFDDIRRKYGR